MPKISPGAIRVGLGLYLPTLLMSCGQGMVAPTIPLVASAFAVSAGLAAQIVTAQSLGRLASLFPAGLGVDRFGTRATMRVGGAFVAAGTGLAVLSPSFLVLLAGQFTVGIGNSVWMLGREIAAINLVRAEQRGRMLTSLFGTSMTGMAVGPVIGGLLADAFDFRAVYLGYLAIAIVALGLTAIFSRPAPEARRRPAPPRVSGGARGPWRALEAINPYYRITFFILFAATFGAQMRNAALNSTLPLYASVQRGLSTTEVGTLFGAIGATNLAMMVPTGFIIDRFGRKAAIVPSITFTALAFALYPVAETLPALLAVSVLVGVASGLSLGAMTASTYDITPDSARGILQSMRRAVGELGSLTGPFLSGIIADRASPAAAFLTLTPFYAVTALLAAFVARETMRKTSPSD